MAARLLGLRIALLLSVFRAAAGTVILRILGATAAAGAAIVLAGLPLWTTDDVPARAAADTVVAAAITLVATLAAFFANRSHLEPRQFGQLPVRPRAIAHALLVTTPVTWSALWLILWSTAVVVLRSETGTAVWAAVLSPILGLVLTILLVRCASAWSKLLVPRHRAGALRAVGGLLLLAALPVGVFAVTQAVRDPEGRMTADAARVLGWTPFGASAAGFALAEAGETSAALLRFAVVGATILLLLILWFPLVRASLERIDRPVDHRAARTGLGWFERVPARPAWAIGARALTYWARDPRYRVGLIAIPIAPAVMIAALWVAGARHEALALIPLPVVLLLLGWSLHNDVATDSTAIWMHVASGIRGRDDRAGRLLPVLLVGVPLALIGSSVTVTVMGDWRVLPAVVGLNLGVLLSACAVSSISSALLPYPTTRPGDAPFAQPSVVGSGSGLAQTLAMLGAMLVSVPPVILAVLAVMDPTFGANLLALVFGAGYGGAVLVAGVLVGGRIFTRAGPELVAITQTFD